MFKHPLGKLFCMARRRSSKTSRTRRRNTISLSGTAQSLIVANAFVKGASNANLMEFFTGRVAHPTYGSLYNPSTKDNVITLPELLGIDKKSTLETNQYGQQIRTGAMTVDAGLQLETMKENVKANWPQMLGTAVVTPIAFKLGKKVLSKAGVTTSANKAFRMIGLSEVRV